MSYASVIFSLRKAREFASNKPSLLVLPGCILACCSTVPSRGSKDRTAALVWSFHVCGAARPGMLLGQVFSLIDVLIAVQNPFSDPRSP